MFNLRNEQIQFPNVDGRVSMKVEATGLRRVYPDEAGTLVSIHAVGEAGRFLRR